MSMRFAIDLDTAGVIRYSNLEAEDNGNGLRRFVLRDKRVINNRWVLLDETWIKRVIGQGESLQEIILLSKISAVAAPWATSINIGVREYNAIIIVWHAGIVQRGGLSCVKTKASSKLDMTWKEILMG
jgi:hypothetical protein